MKIEIKNLKYAEFASEETNCFRASVWIDGKRVCEASNDGHGGATSFSDDDARKRIDEYAKTLPPLVSDLPDPDDPTKPFTLQKDAEILIDELVEEALIRKDFDKLIRSRLIWLKEGRIYQSKKLTKEELTYYLTKNGQALRADGCLNVLSFDEGLALYKAHA